MMLINLEALYMCLVSELRKALLVKAEKNVGRWEMPGSACTQTNIKKILSAFVSTTINQPTMKWQKSCLDGYTQLQNLWTESQLSPIEAFLEHKNNI